MDFSAGFHFPICPVDVLPTLFRMITASWLAPVMLKVSPDSPSRMVYSSLALSPKSASVAEIRPTSAPATANSDTENSQEPTKGKRFRRRDGKRDRDIDNFACSYIISIWFSKSFKLKDLAFHVISIKSFSIWFWLDWHPVFILSVLCKGFSNTNHDNIVKRPPVKIKIILHDIIALTVFFKEYNSKTN